MVALKKSWILLALEAILIIGHSGSLYHVLSRPTWTVVLGVVLLVVLAHLGVFRLISGYLTRRFR